MLSKNQIKEIQSLQIKKFRDAKKLFIAEGVKTVDELLAQDPGSVNEIYGTKDFIHSHLAQLRRLNIRFTEITDDELKKISLQAAPNNTLAICKYFPEPVSLFDFGNNFSLYLDDVRDPGNLGTIIRLADWFGISTIFCSPATCDLYNPKVIQSTMGAFLRVKVVYIALDVLIDSCNIKYVYGGLLDGKNIYTERLKNGLVVIGNEANGISDQNLKLITNPVTIPANRNNGTESLNAAMATAIITAEFFRQRTTGE